MPIYTYHCNSCNTDRDYFVQSYKNHPLVCDNCDAQGRLERHVVQSFSVGSSSGQEKDHKGSPKGDTKLEKALDNLTYAQIKRYLKAIGGKKMGDTTLNCLIHGPEKFEAWKIPDHSIN